MHVVFRHTPSQRSQTAGNISQHPMRCPLIPGVRRGVDQVGWMSNDGLDSLLQCICQVHVPYDAIEHDGTT